MALDGHLRQLLDEVKYRRGFPPKNKIQLIRNQLVLQGLGQSGALVQAIADAYLEVVENVLDEFTEIVAARSKVLGLNSQADVRRVIAQAHQEMFDLARGLTLGDFGGPSSGAFGTLGMARVDDRRDPVRQHLERTIELRRFDESQAAVSKEREQKFRILWSVNQAATDFEAWAAEARKWENPVSLLFIDLDHFKAFNERYTHAKVDETLLPDAQNILAKHAQGRGEAYRYGGEEFLVILPNHDANEAQAIAEKIRVSFEERQFEVDGTPERVTVSIGVATFPEHGDSYKAVLEAANEAEREAKRTRNIVKLALAK